MAKFDEVCAKKGNFVGYKGEPPTSESEYNAMKAGAFTGTPPTWSSIKSDMDSYVRPSFSGNKKLLDLGLSQAEITALTGYIPPAE